MSSLVGREIITSSENIEEYLSDFVINADHIGAFSSNFAISMYIITAILIIYAAFEIIMALKKRNETGNIIEGAAEETAETEEVAETEEAITKAADEADEKADETEKTEEEITEKADEITEALEDKNEL